MKIKRRVEPVSRFGRALYWLIIKRVREYWQKSLKANFLALSCVTVLGFVILSAPLDILAQSSNGHHSLQTVTLKHQGQTQIMSTYALTVGDFLKDLKIDLDTLDKVTPSLNTPIQSSDLTITISKGRYVKIIDGQKQNTEITTQTMPRQILKELGYKIKSVDKVNWVDSSLMDSFTLIPTLKISRQYTYKINKNGQVKTYHAYAQKVEDILKELNLSLNNIDYIQPSLKEVAKTDEPIVVYYKKPNQKIEFENKTKVKGDNSQEIEYAYQVLFNKVTQKVMERNLIYQRVIKSLPKDTINSAAFETSNDLISLNRDVQNLLTLEQKQWLVEAKIDIKDWYFVYYIVLRESNWRPFVWNQSGSSAYGLCQALPAHRMSKFGADYMSNPITQLKWCQWYAFDRYGSWEEAYKFWLNNRWW